MRAKMKWLLASSLFLGTLPLTAGCDPFASVLAAERPLSQAQLHQELNRAWSQRLGSLKVTYSGKESTLKKEIKEILNNALYADDYLHYIVKTYGYNATIKGNTATISFKFTYWETLAQSNEVKKRVTHTLKRILTPGMNDFQKEKAIHDWIVTNVSYDTRLVSYSAYDGIVNGQTVCQGYALLTYEMMRQAGIPVKIVEGTSRGIAHTWNLVQLGGKWYHIDTTWDDPVPDEAGRIAYNYYNLTDSQIRIDHKWKPSALYPTAVTSFDQTLASLSGNGAAKAEFYKKLYDQLGLAYLAESNTATSLQELTSRIQTAVGKRQKQLVIRYTRGVTFKSDMKKAFSAQKGLSSYSYTFEDYTRTTTNDKLLRIVFNYS
ncbi:transglutaminase domain-containing protein [Cohnella cholangitidis]|uniref:Transglutaminase n=1 Tax=Cohnella cholangitidis TaxID=2598458 RepID=A0A7G5C0H9_9BACL|nr:transglutaminase domain-containing protein [Cohnella cholangitidis]QMV42713.1 transglutaminase [Cohnella cholangitidis]